MKRILLFFILYFGVFTYTGYAQIQDSQLRDYLHQTKGNDYDYEVMPSNCNCAVREVNLVTGAMQIIYGTAAYVASNPGVAQYAAAHANDPDPQPDPDDQKDPSENEYDENRADFLEGLQEFQDRVQDVLNWLNDNSSNQGPGSEDGGGEAPPRECVIDEFGYDSDMEKVIPTNHCVAAASLPCSNSFLLANRRIIHFTPTQQSRIAQYCFDGSTLISFVDVNGVVYTNALAADLTSFNIKCEPDWEVRSSKIAIKEIRSTYKFIAFDRVRTDAGTAALPATEYLPDIKVWMGIPADNMNYCIEVPVENTEPAAAGKVVTGCTAGGVLYCETLTAEDAILTTTTARNERFKLKRLHLDHYLNVPKWVADFFNKLALYPGDCAIDYVNAKLDELHQSPDYINIPDDDMKKKVEFETVAYDLLFGILYCNTDEATAKDKSAAVQFTLGLLHETIATIDVKQLVIGVTKIVKGIGSVVADSVKNVITAVKDVIIQETTLGTVDYEQIVKKFLEANNSQLNNIYEKAKTIAIQFKETYFTKCGADPAFGDICAYRYGQVTMMVIPIVLTAGDWAIVKVDALVAKYVANTDRAIQLMRDAAAAARVTAEETYIVLDDVGTASSVEKTVIRESNGTVHSTIKQEGTPGNEVVVITEAADFISQSKLSSLTTEVPTVSGNLSKAKFANESNTLKIDPQVDGNLTTAVDDIITNLDVTGTKTETLVQDYLFEQKMGLQRLDGKYGSNNGLDGIFLEGTTTNPTKIYITECKQQWGGGVSLAPANFNTGLEAQMSERWIKQVSASLRNAGKTVVADLIDNNPGLIEKFVITVNKSTRDINLLKLGKY